MAEPTRMIVFDGMLSEKQASVVKSIYVLFRELPDEVRRVVAKDLAATYGNALIDGCSEVPDGN
jgi:hypothetical protein